MEKKPVTAEEIKSYLNNTLSSSEQRRIENEMLNNHLFAEAMEGFEQFPEAIEKSLTAKNKLKASLKEKSHSNWKYNSLLIAASIALLVGSFVSFYLLNNRVNNKQTIAENVAVNPLKKDLKQALNSSPATAEKEAVEILKKEDAPELIKPTEKAFSTQKLAPSSSTLSLTEAPKVSSLPDENDFAENTQETAAIVSNNSKTEEYEIAQAYSNSPSSYEKTASASPVRSAKKINAPAKGQDAPSNAIQFTPTKYIYNLKVVDYASLNPERNKNQFLPALNHLEASFENKDAKEGKTHKEEPIQQISYNDFLELAILKFNNKNFKMAIADFLTILKHYPDDINALFYSGLAYYQSDKPERAVLIFEEVKKHKIPVFTEEADWYKALALEKSNKKEEAIQQLHRIKSENGFYSKMAGDKLKMLNK